MNRKTTLFCVLIIVGATLPCFSLMLKLSLAELVSNAEMIVVGKVVEKECRWGETGEWIYTYVTVSVDEYIKGEGENEIVLMHPGGEVGKKGLMVGNMPSFREGEEVLVFLRKGEEDLASLDLQGDAGGIYSVSGLAQGKYDVTVDETGEKMVKNDFSDLFAQHEDGMQIIDEKAFLSTRLSEFVSEIREILQEQQEEE